MSMFLNYPYRIELRDAGVWFDIDGAATFSDACAIASMHCGRHREDSVQICGPNGINIE